MSHSWSHDHTPWTLGCWRKPKYPEKMNTKWGTPHTLEMSRTQTTSPGGVRQPCCPLGLPAMATCSCIYLICVCAEKYFKMKKAECKDGLEIYKRFLTRMTRISEFFKLAEVNILVSCWIRSTLYVLILRMSLSALPYTASWGRPKRRSWPQLCKFPIISGSSFNHFIFFTT